MNVKPYAKAVVGGLAAGLVNLAEALAAGSDGGTTVTAQEWVYVALACLAGAGVVYGVPNVPNPPLSTNPAEK